MIFPKLARNAFGLGVAAAILGGCAGRDAASFAPAAPMQSQNVAAQPSGLVYVSNFNGNDVAVYTYPQFKPAGTLTGFLEPQGMCVDANGDVWIADTGAQNLVEYAHGGSTPIRTLKDPGSPSGCSIDGKNGDLAVPNVGGSGSNGGVAIYKHARGKPKVYSQGGFFAGYDAAGNLFIDGLSSFGMFLAELPAGGSAFQSVTLSGVSGDAFPGNIQWDGRHLALGNQSGSNGSVIYRLKVQRNVATVIDTTTLEGSVDVVGFFIFGTGPNRRVLGPDAGSGQLGVYRYPAGGAPFKTPQIGPAGAAVISFASSGH